MKDKLISGGVGVVTGATGFAGIVEMIPEGISKVACLIGICLSVIVCIVTVRKSTYDCDIAKLEIERIKLEISKNGGSVK